MTDRVFYCDPSATYNGDGSSASEASGEGQPGCFNTISAFLVDEDKSNTNDTFTCYVRSGTTETRSGSVSLDDAGTLEHRIVLKAATDGDDPWSDSYPSANPPIINLNGNYWGLTAEKYWLIRGLKIQGGCNTYGMIGGYRQNGLRFEDCIIYNTTGASATAGAFWIHSLSNDVELLNCEFYDCQTYAVIIGPESSNVRILGCTFNGGSSQGTDYAIYSRSPKAVEIRDCDFGAVTSFDGAVFRCENGASYHCLNCTFNSEVMFTENATYPGDSYIVSEDHEGVQNAVKIFTRYGTVERETTVVRSGGADTSAKLTTRGMTGNSPPTLKVNPPRHYDFAVELTADVEKTISVYVRGFGWTAFPAANQLLLECLYYDSESDAGRARVVSSQTISDNSTWTALSVTITPEKTGFAYLNLKLGAYEDGCGVYVDVEPVVT